MDSVSFTWMPTTGSDAGKTVVLTLVGTSFVDPFSLNSGSWDISSISATVNNHPAWSITGLGAISLTGAELLDAINNANPAHLLFSGGDSITGSSGNDVLVGYDGDDTIRGGAGNDKLDGNKGHDQLTGGAGHDVFEFNEVLNTNLALDNYATITDFSPSQDRIELTYDIFKNVAGFGVLAASQFHVGPAATTFAQRIIYNASNGDLFYDPDGKGSAHQMLFAILSNHAALAAHHTLPTAADFLIV
jgi:Ca2+-binding RTX toxin-like protein